MNWPRSVLLFFAVASAAAGASATSPAKDAAGRRDAVIVLVNESGNPELSKISFSTLRKIFSCQITNWQQVPGSKRTDSIAPFRPDDNSTATKIFKQRIGGVTFGPCVTMISGPNADEIIASGLAKVPPTAKVKELTQGIGFLGWRVPKEGSHALQIANDNKPGNGPFIAPSEQEISKRRYPLAAR